ncbi:hypothetical protein SFRURICE_003690 [Spodoptera frugiperda]|nr:hypothetical protein SFRURICE_003690 [Spodoptera frugiperda]
MISLHVCQKPEPWYARLSAAPDQASALSDPICGGLMALGNLNYTQGGKGPEKITTPTIHVQPKTTTSI